MVDPRPSSASSRGLVAHRLAAPPSSASGGRAALLGDPADLVVDALLRDAEGVRDVLHTRAEVQGALDAARLELLEVAAEHPDPVQGAQRKGIGLVRSDLAER